MKVMLAPLLRFEPVACSGLDADYGAVLATSANAFRVPEGQLGDGPLEMSPVAVGEATAAAASKAGFGKVMAADGDAAALRDLVLAGVKKRQFREERRAALSCGRRSRARSRALVVTGAGRDQGCETATESGSLGGRSHALLLFVRSITGQPGDSPSRARVPRSRGWRRDSSSRRANQGRTPGSSCRIREPRTPSRCAG